MLEIFCGCSRLSKACEKAGYLVVPGVDLDLGPMKLDVLDDIMFSRVKRMIRQKGVAYLHLATPCSTFSLARRGRSRCRDRLHPLGFPGDVRVQDGNLLAERSAELIGIMRDRVASGAWKTRCRATSGGTRP